MTHPNLLVESCIPRVEAVADCAVSINPATGMVIAASAFLSEAAIALKLETAKIAFEEHRRRSYAERADILRSIARTLERERDSLARLISLEMGKLFRTSCEEISKCAQACRYFSTIAEQMLSEEVVDAGPNFRHSVRREPIGAILALTTWNFPFWQVFRVAAPALMVGNVCLVKHSANVAQCSLALEGVFQRSGVPRGLLQSLVVRESQIENLIGDPRVAAVTVTGNVVTGRHIAAMAGRYLKKVALELGGNDAFIVLPSADLKEALDAAVTARVTASGQSCTAAKRFIIAAEVADEFESCLATRLDSLVVGDPHDDRSQVGPMATERVVEALEGQIRLSVAQGCRVLAGGARLDRPGYFFDPTLLTHIAASSPAYTEELYGPVAALFRVADLESAVRLANDSVFGLGASVWTRSREEQERCVQSLQVGLVSLNKRVRSEFCLPFGGVKQSGFGRELGREGLLQFTATKSISASWGECAR
jgi:succinate-semialdehyde dehydrogenase / glutarate-semialdehyde dehydrogenase